MDVILIKVANVLSLQLSLSLSSHPSPFLSICLSVCPSILDESFNLALSLLRVTSDYSNAICSRSLTTFSELTGKWLLYALKKLSANGYLFLSCTAKRNKCILEKRVSNEGK